MKKNLVWIVLAASIALAAYFVLSGRFTDSGPHYPDSEVERVEDFDKIHPTGEDMKLGEMDITFSNGEKRVQAVTDKVTPTADKVK